MGWWVSTVNFRTNFSSVVFNKDKEIQIEMGKKEAEVLRLRRRLKARRPRQTQCHYFNDESHVAAAGYDTVRAMCSVDSRVGTRREGLGPRPLVAESQSRPTPTQFAFPARRRPQRKCGKCRQKEGEAALTVLSQTMLKTAM